MVTQVRTDHPIPSYSQGFARNAAESARPQDWTGLIGFWTPSVGPAGGDTVEDLSGYGHPGTWVNIDAGSDYIIDGQLGRLVDLDGVDQRLDVGNISSTLFSGPFTIMLWASLACRLKSLSLLR